MLVGLPMMSAMLQVLAATNSVATYGIGLIFAALAK